MQPAATQREVITAMADAGIVVVTLPISSMHLQDRAPGMTNGRFRAR